jgi:hypothetical protein
MFSRDLLPLIADSLYIFFQFRCVSDAFVQIRQAVRTRGIIQARSPVQRIGRCASLREVPLRVVLMNICGSFEQTRTERPRGRGRYKGT